MLGRTISVLIVDDDEDDYILVREILNEIQGTSFLTSWASSYAQGRERLSEGKYDVCLIDHNLGEETGIDLIRASTESGCQKPLILMTGQGDYEIDLKAMEVGAMDFLPKRGLSLTLLERSLRYAIKHSETLAALREVTAQLKAANEDLRKLSNTDGLTGLLNKRRFLEIFHQQWQTAMRQGYSLSMILIDIDFFKLYNDTYGHQQGDECLASVAKSLETTLQRSTDFAARYGGEEFIILLVGLNEADAGKVGEVLRANVEKLGIPHRNSKAGKVVTISVGVASLTPSQKTTAEELIGNADLALYESKHKGRNLVTLNKT